MTDHRIAQAADTITHRRRDSHTPGDCLFAAEIQDGDRIAAGFLPSALPADVIFVEPYTNPRGEAWVFVAFREDGYGPTSDVFLADAAIPIERLAGDDGMGYSREAEDSAPVSPARGVVSPSAYVDGGEIFPIDRP